MKHRELAWLLVVVVVVGVGFRRAGRIAEPAPSPPPSPVAARAAEPSPDLSPTGEVPRYRGPLSRAQFSLEMIAPYHMGREGGFRFHARGRDAGAHVTVSLNRDQRVAMHEVDLSAPAWRDFFDRLEAGGVWTLRSNDVDAHRDLPRYEAYIQAGQWTHRAVFCDAGDAHVAAFLSRALAGSILARQYETLARESKEGPMDWPPTFPSASQPSPR